MITLMTDFIQNVLLGNIFYITFCIRKFIETILKSFPIKISTFIMKDQNGNMIYMLRIISV